MVLHLTTCPMMSNDVTMVVDIHGYNAGSSANMNLYVPRCTKELCKRSFLYKGSMLWNDLPDILKESSSLDVFESNYRVIIGWQISEYIWVYLYVDLHFFNPSHISIMFLHFTEAPIYLKSLCLYFTFRVLYKRFFFIILIFWNNLSNILWTDFYLMLICNLSICIVRYYLIF